MRFIFLSLFFVTSVWAQTQNSCEQPERDTILCYKMKHMVSLINLFDSQRDLMQTNYPLMKSLAADLEQVVDQIMITNTSTPHIKDVVFVKMDAQEIQERASAEDIETFKIANSIKSKCLNCHGEVDPKSGYKWSDVTAQGWAQVLPTCNESGRNPYICKSMFALKADLNYMSATTLSGITTFQTIAEIAKDMKRVANDVGTKMASHGDELPLSDVETHADEIMTMALAGSPKALAKATKVYSSCIQCHSSPDNPPTHR